MPKKRNVKRKRAFPVIWPGSAPSQTLSVRQCTECKALVMTDVLDHAFRCDMLPFSAGCLLRRRQD